MNPFDSSSDEDDKAEASGIINEENSGEKGDVGTNDPIPATAADNVNLTTSAEPSPDKGHQPPSSTAAAERIRTGLRRSSHHRQQSEEEGSKRTRRGHNNIHRPWQYDWKSPTWWSSKNITTNKDNNTGSSATKISRHTASCLDVTSAQVLWEECCYPPQSDPLPNKKYKPEGRNFMLSVSLISSSESSSPKVSSVPPSAVGTKIQLELWAYKDQESSNSEGESGKSSPSSPSSLFYGEDEAGAVRSNDPTEAGSNSNKNEMECLASKVLTWPGSQMHRGQQASAKDSDDKDKEDDHKQKNLWSWVKDFHRNLISSPVLPLTDFKVSSQNHSEEEERGSGTLDKKLDQSDGVVSISLCRLMSSSAASSSKKFSSDGEEIEANITSAATNSSLTDIVKAQELISLLSLGGSIGVSADGNDNSAVLSAMLNSDKLNTISNTIPPPVDDSSAPSLPHPTVTAISTKESSTATSPLVTPTSSPGRPQQGRSSRSSSQASDVGDEKDDGGEDEDLNLDSTEDLGNEANTNSAHAQTETSVAGSNRVC